MKRKRTPQLILSFIMVVFGIALIATAFFVPPTGEINGSVLTAYGETLTFAGSLIGIDYHYRYKSKEKDEEDNSDPPLAAC